jgi:alkylated DNA repair dioxygenase AlkB
MGPLFQPRLFNLEQMEYAPMKVIERDGLVTYDPYFLEPAIADDLFERLMQMVAWKQDEIRMYGRTIPVPRLTAWYGEPDASYTYSGIQNIPNAWIDPISVLRSRIEDATHVGFNSVLLNLYRNGRDSLSWHADDEPELGTQPVIASVSLGVTRTFQLQHRVDGEAISLALEHGSLLLMSGLTQSFWKHQIPKERGVSGERINLTFRNIDAQIRRGSGERVAGRPRSERPKLDRR